MRGAVPGLARRDVDCDVVCGKSRNCSMCSWCCCSGSPSGPASSDGLVATGDSRALASCVRRESARRECGKLRGYGKILSNGDIYRDSDCHNFNQTMNNFLDGRVEYMNRRSQPYTIKVSSLVFQNIISLRIYVKDNTSRIHLSSNMNKQSIYNWRIPFHTDSLNIHFASKVLDFQALVATSWYLQRNVNICVCIFERMNSYDTQ